MRNLSADEVKEIPRMVESGMRMGEISKKFGVSKSAIQSWINKYRKALSDKGEVNPLPILKGRPPKKLNI